MLIGLNLQRKLHSIIDNNDQSPSISFRKLGITISLSYKDGHLYKQGPQTGSFLFTTMELAQFNRNLGHAPAGAV